MYLLRYLFIELEPEFKRTLSAAVLIFGLAAPVILLLSDAVSV